MCLDTADATPAVNLATGGAVDHAHTAGKAFSKTVVVDGTRWR